MKKPTPVFTHQRVGMYSDVTPAALRCAIAASCPSLFEGPDTYVIIGKLISPQEPEIRRRVGASEVAIEVPRELLDGQRSK